MSLGLSYVSIPISDSLSIKTHFRTHNLTCSQSEIGMGQMGHHKNSPKQIFHLFASCVTQFFNIKTSKIQIRIAKNYNFHQNLGLTEKSSLLN